MHCGHSFGRPLIIATPLQVLATDIRSLHQRTNVLPVQTAAIAGPLCGGIADGEASQGQERSSHGQYSVSLDRVYVSYDLDTGSGAVLVRGAEPALNAN
jgi:hypothetical protein